MNGHMTGCEPKVGTIMLGDETHHNIFLQILLV